MYTRRNETLNSQTNSLLTLLLILVPLPLINTPIAILHNAMAMHFPIEELSCVFAVRPCEVLESMAVDFPTDKLALIVCPILHQ